jgi:hypothetical protein
MNINIVQQVHIKIYVQNTGAWKMYNITVGKINIWRSQRP